MGAFLRPSAEPDGDMPARMGDVAWNHDFHARMEDIASCTVCHHTEHAGNANPKPCSHCHTREVEQALITPDLFEKVPEVKYEGENGPPLMTALHNKCIGCHKAMEKGPVGCGDCHTQTFSGVHGRVTWDHRTHARGLDMDDEPGLEDNCVHCHHQDEKAITDGEYRACNTCHKPVISHEEIHIQTQIRDHKDYKHFECKKCHTLFNPEDDPVNCQECHKEMAVDTEHGERPPIEVAIHERCGECHNRDYPGLTSEMPVTCEGCHQPDPSWLHIPESQDMLWDHKIHSSYKDMDCTTCHHTDSTGEHHMACYKCHESGLFDNPPVSEVVEKTCVECHEERGVILQKWTDMDSEKAAETYYHYEGKDGGFWWNHRGHAVDKSFSCQNCHHYLIQRDGKFIMDEKTPGSWPEEARKVQTCKNCHGEEGPVVGSAAEGSEAPSYNDALKKICTECHKRLEGGPQTWEELFEVEPLERPEWKDRSDSHE
jgi:hypothetical protein